MYACQASHPTSSKSVACPPRAIGVKVEPTQEAIPQGRLLLVLMTIAAFTQLLKNNNKMLYSLLHVRITLKCTHKLVLKGVAIFGVGFMYMELLRVCHNRV